MYRLSAKDNGLYFFRGRRDVRRCSACGALKNKWGEDIGSAAWTGNLKDEVSNSYDGVLVVSPRFRSVVEGDGMTGLDFRHLAGGFFNALPNSVVPFDSVRRLTRFEKKCKECGQYGSVIGATPVFLLPGAEPPENGFVRTDLEFGSGDEKAPIILCGDKAADRLLREHLSGLDLLKA